MNVFTNFINKYFKNIMYYLKYYNINILNLLLILNKI